MAAKKKKKKAAPRKPKRAAARKAVRKAAAKRAPVKKAKTAKKPVKKKAASREYGEGNYKASKRFRTKQEAFVKKNKAKIPALGQAAEAALDGAEGGELRAAEASAAQHAVR